MINKVKDLFNVIFERQKKIEIKKTEDENSLKVYGFAGLILLKMVVVPKTIKESLYESYVNF